MKKITPQYIAGFFDGEGCISANEWGAIFIIVVNTDERVIRAIRDYFNFGRVKRESPKQENHRTRYIWQVSSWQAYEVLEKIKPYLIIKKEQAEIAMRLQEMQRENHTSAYKPLTSFEIQQRKALIEELKHWKRKFELQLKFSFESIEKLPQLELF